jgi:hypothetical protein
MDLGAWLGANHSDAWRIARICNNARRPKARFYVPKSLQHHTRSLSDLKNRSEKMAERGQFLTISPGNSRSIAQENGEKWTVPTNLQPISL